MLLVDIAANAKTGSLGCMFVWDEVTEFSVFSPGLAMFIFVVQKTLTSLSLCLLYTSFLEFICAQSPQSMKGMLIGSTYAFLLGVFKNVTSTTF